MIVLCLLTGLIKAIRCGKGAVHDYKMFKKSGITIYKQSKIKADSGFQGIKDDFPNARTPHKATKLKSLTKEQKAENKVLAQERIPIEHINRDCKIFKITQQTYRGKHKNYHKTWLLVAAIVNLKKCTSHLKYARAA